MKKNSDQQGKMTGVLKENIAYLNERLAVDVSFDLVYRVIRIGGKDACIYFIDGFCKDELMQNCLLYTSPSPRD